MKTKVLKTGSSSPGNGIADELAKLAELKKQGVVSESEFCRAKDRLLNSPVESAATPTAPVSQPTVEPPPDTSAVVSDFLHQPMGLRQWSVLLGAGVSIFALFWYVLLPTSNPSTQTSPTATPETPVSMERKLATIDCTCPVADDDVRALRFRSLLQQLSEKYEETPERIADMSVACRSSLREKGVSESVINIMEGMNQVFNASILSSSGINTQKYAEHLAAYIVVRNTGSSHADAIELMPDAHARLRLLTGGR